MCSGRKISPHAGSLQSDHRRNSRKRSWLRSPECASQCRSAQRVTARFLRRVGLTRCSLPQAGLPAVGSPPPWYAGSPPQKPALASVTAVALPSAARPRIALPTSASGATSSSGLPSGPPRHSCRFHFPTRRRRRCSSLSCPPPWQCRDLMRLPLPPPPPTTTCQPHLCPFLPHRWRR
jgi:hypothetical protein